MSKQKLELEEAQREAMNLTYEYRRILHVKISENYNDDDDIGKFIIAHEIAQKHTLVVQAWDAKEMAWDKWKKCKDEFIAQEDE